jgi:hypothetical protein
MVSAESAFIRQIKRFQLTDLLVQIGELSRFLFHKDSSILEVPFTQIVGPYQRRGSITVTAWWLVDIAYLAIANTNDFARSVPSRQDLMQICSEFISYDEQRTEITLGPTPTMVDLMTYLFGVAEKTFWYQELYKTKGKFNRDVELLETIPESVGSVINVNDIILRSTGFTAKQFRKLLLALFAVSLKQVDLTVVTANGTALRWDPILTQENLQSVIEMYSAQYSEYRNSILNENYFIVKPIVKTLRNRYVSVSPFLLSRKMYDGVFWKVRDFYNATERDKQLFTNEFGKLFEIYVQNLLEHYLDPAQYRRIDQSSEKGADWIVSSSNYTILVEQKSTVMSLLLRTPYIDDEDLDRYAERLVEAVEQLDRSESRYCEDHGSNPKLILLYDERLMAENMLRERIVSLATDRIENLENYFLISIGDFEHLIQILSENPSSFERIMDYKIRVAQSQPREGQEFYQIIPRFYDKGNLYIHNVINHYNTYLGRAG